ncbi:MAG: hypothetical protein FWK04_23470 [Nostoc sp. GBBB01]|nr:hypothetical protein [Nostoc sp. GBBB01]
MDNYVQLELFDLQSYTSEQPSLTEDVAELVEDFQQLSNYVQLELDLFAEQFYKTPLELFILAA